MLSSNKSSFKFTAFYGSISRYFLNISVFSTFKFQFVYHSKLSHQRTAPPQLGPSWVVDRAVQVVKIQGEVASLRDGGYQAVCKAYLKVAAAEQSVRLAEHKMVVL